MVSIDGLARMKTSEAVSHRDGVIGGQPPTEGPQHKRAVDVRLKKWRPAGGNQTDL